MGYQVEDDSPPKRENRTVSLACHAVTQVSLHPRVASLGHVCLLTARNSCDSCSPTIGSILTDTRDQSSANDKVDQHLLLGSKAYTYTYTPTISRSSRDHVLSFRFYKIMVTVTKCDFLDVAESTANLESVNDSLVSVREREKTYLRARAWVNLFQSYGPAC